MDPSPGTEQEERRGQQIMGQKQPVRPEEGTPRWVWWGRNEDQAPPVFLSHKASYMAFLYLPCLFFFTDNRTINTRRNWQERTLSQP